MDKAILLFIILIFTACSATRPVSSPGTYEGYLETNPPITRSLFSDKNATISEENIQKILDGNYSLPNELRVAIVKLESNQYQSSYYLTNEAYLKSQQAYLDLFKNIFNQSKRTKKVSTIPDMLISSNPTFTNIRESAVRTQSDIAVIYSINSDIYSKYKLFAKSDIKAFATTELIILDIRTGLIPFTTIVTKEFQSKRQDNELNENEAANRIKEEAVLLTIEEIGTKLKKFLDGN